MVYMLSVPAEIADADRVTHVEVMLNQSFQLSCAADGLPRPRVTWFFEDRPIHNTTDDVFLVDDGWTLNVAVARLHHAGRYSCRAVNVAGEDHRRFTLAVLGTS